LKFKFRELMEILEAFDLTGRLRSAAKLAGCDRKTVAHWVAGARCGWRRVAGVGAAAAAGRCARGEDRGVVDRNRRRILDVAHQRLVAMCDIGSERTTRRAVTEAKRRWRAEHWRCGIGRCRRW
jgi:hypothetical protein